jgi:prophage tail gpP-like protein
MRTVSYTDRAEEAQQEQLDWLSQIAEESRAQTHLLRTIARHTGLLYWSAIVGLVLVGIWLLAQLYDVIHA